MNTKNVLNLFKRAVREVIKEELTEILLEGLQSTINEMSQPKKSTKTETVRVASKMVNDTSRKPKVHFNENKWASILNETEAINDKTMPVESFVDLMNESYDTISFTSADARNFITQKQLHSTEVPSVMHDPETGKNFEVKPEVAAALTRDYSALMKAINAKKGK